MRETDEHSPCQQPAPPPYCYVVFSDIPSLALLSCNATSSEYKSLPNVSVAFRTLANMRLPFCKSEKKSLTDYAIYVSTLSMRRHSVRYNRAEYAEYLRSPTWKAIRKTVLDSSPMCLKCGKRLAKELHHLIYRRDVEDVRIMSDILPLCRECHQLVTDAIRMRLIPNPGRVKRSPKAIEKARRATLGIVKATVSRERSKRSKYDTLTDAEIQEVLCLPICFQNRIRGILKLSTIDNLAGYRQTGIRIARVRHLLKICRKEHSFQDYSKNILHVRKNVPQMWKQYQDSKSLVSEVQQISKNEPVCAQKHARASTVGSIDSTVPKQEMAAEVTTQAAPRGG